MSDETMLEENGLPMRKLELWVPDTNDPRVASELRRQSVLASQGEDEEEVMGFLENVSCSWSVYDC
jgi:hypothetical protein